MGEQLEMQAYHIQEFLYNSVQPLRDETEEKEPYESNKSPNCK